MCNKTQTFTTCHLCGHTSLNPFDFHPPTHCDNFSESPTSHATSVHENTVQICEMCRLSEARDGIDPYVRPAAPTPEVAEARGTMTSDDWGRAFQEQRVLVDIFKYKILTCEEDHDAALETELSFSNRSESDPHPGVQMALELVKDDDEEEADSDALFEPCSTKNLLPRDVGVTSNEKLSSRKGPKRQKLSHHYDLSPSNLSQNNVEQTAAIHPLAQDAPVTAPPATPGKHRKCTANSP